jgi:ASTRA-associated protein 1
VLPVHDQTFERKQPWLLHSLTTNTLNFCSFASIELATTGDGDSILVATPGVQDGYINVTSLPNENRIATIPTPKDVKTGMIMAIGLQYQQSTLTILAGYESGHAAVWRQDQQTKYWRTTYVDKSHTQPILSLGVCVEQSCFFTSSADAIIAQHPIQDGGPQTKQTQTKHAGQQSLTVRSDQKIFATAGWDGRGRVYSTKSLKELAVLKWHKEGCYALAFAQMYNVPAQSSTDTEGIQDIVERKLTVSQKRTEKTKTTHWIAAGSKDGKVSLWDVY